MDAFQAPYKAVLIVLYESAVQNGNQAVMASVKEYFDIHFTDLADRFRSLGLDDNLVKPSYVINVGVLQSKIQEQVRKDPEIHYNHDNAVFLENIVKEMNLLMGEGNA